MDALKSSLECALVWVFNMELNKITRELLKLGYTKEKPPDKFREWNDFYGGWQYTVNQEQNIVVEAPCGIIGNAYTIGAGSLCCWLGVDWCLENDNALIACPFNKLNCPKNNPLISDKKIAGSVQCPVHITCKAFDYDSSIEKIRAENEAKKEALYKEFCAERGGKACRNMSRFDEAKGKWSIRYNPMNCLNCSYCTLLDKDMGTAKGNVFYDVKTTYLQKNNGFIPDEKVSSIIKGKRLFDKSKNLELCKIVAKCCRKEIESKVRNKYSSELVFAEYFGHFFEVEVLNIRAEKRESRDLDQDLKDIADGIEVIHQSDLNAAEKERKKQTRLKSVDNKVKRIKKLILQGGLAKLDWVEKSRLGKLLDKELITQDDLKAWQAEFEKNQYQKQMSLF